MLALFSGSARSYRHSPEIPINCIEPDRYGTTWATYLRFLLSTLFSLLHLEKQDTTQYIINNSRPAILSWWRSTLHVKHTKSFFSFSINTVFYHPSCFLLQSRIIQCIYFVFLKRISWATLLQNIAICAVCIRIIVYFEAFFGVMANQEPGNPVTFANVNKVFHDCLLSSLIIFCEWNSMHQKTTPFWPPPRWDQELRGYVFYQDFSSFCSSQAFAK